MSLDLRIILLWLISFPYVQVGFSVSDVSPYWLIVGTAIVAKGLRFSVGEALLFIAVLSSITFSGTLSFTDLRGLIPAIGFCLALALGSRLKMSNTMLKRHLRLIVIIYIIAGFIQLYIDPNLFTFATSREFGYAGRGGRGVESLTAEPTFLGFIALIFIFISYVEQDRRLMWLSIFLLFFISRSSSAIASFSIILVMFPLTYVLKTILNSIVLLKINRHQLKAIAAITLIFVLMVFIFSQFLPGLRFSQILNKGLSIDALLAFPSINDRISHIYASHYLAFQNLLMPHGYNSFYNEIQTLKTQTPWMGVIGGANGRIMSLSGSFLYELGIIGGFILCLFYYFFYQSVVQLNRDVSLSLVLTLSVALVTLQAIPVGLPTLPFFVAFYSSRYRFNAQ